MDRIDLSAVLCHKGNHHAIADRIGLSVFGDMDRERGAAIRVGPDHEIVECHDLFCRQFGQQRIIKRGRACQISSTKGRISNHFEPPYVSSIGSLTDRMLQIIIR
ncbi:hypothetical protein ACFQFQ_28115 [Sulfitobacter porphyrae]|uniref:Uncharacterized protein n=1 Tax=Sulfitobacter porphyrae TaxID=1246864 RepID=A0ABW2B9X9_9RHOB